MSDFDFLSTEWKDFHSPALISVPLVPISVPNSQPLINTNEAHGVRCLLKQEGCDLMGAAFEVYNVLGYGMAEEIYQQSLEIELGLCKIPFLSKTELQVRYKDKLLTTVYRPDLLVHNEIVVELKATKTLAPEHEAQLFNYMRISEKRVGYLVNYGSSGEMEWKRIVL